MATTILEKIQNPVAFDAFVNENMKSSTYKVGWNAEMDVEYEASKTWAAATADYAAAMVGTVIDKNSDRPKHDMPSIGELSGALSHMGDEWQIDNDRLERYYFMEQRFRDREKNLTNDQKLAQKKAINKYLFNPFELAAIAPHRRILAQYYEGLSDGQVTLTKTNNERGLVWSTALSIGIDKKNLRSTDVVWSTATLATMDVIAVLMYAQQLAEEKGKTILRHRVSKATAQLIMQCTQFKNLIGTNIGKIRTNTSPGIDLATINAYLGTFFIAPIEITDEVGLYSNGTSFSMFKSGRLVCQCAPRVAVLKVSDPLEMIDPVPDVIYTSYFDNLVSHWRDKKGRNVAYEMFAFPAFTGKNDVFILDVTQKET